VLFSKSPGILADHNEFKLNFAIRRKFISISAIDVKWNRRFDFLHQDKISPLVKL